ncbi:MAG: gamma carbonic anhydrase family protein [Gammaproteobacteria bacterium]|nr:gamma carbonic anhydrase family protein [Gammaproteobacteria bacterium]
MTIRAFEERHPQLGAGAYVDDLALLVGAVEIGADSSIWPFSVVRADVNWIRIGARTNVQDNCVLHVSHDSDYHPGGYPTLLGNDITVGHQVVLHGCEIGDGCLIGMGTVIMDGAVIEPHTLIAAGSLVTAGKRLEGGYLWRGRPAQRIRVLTQTEHERLLYSAQHYVALKNRHLQSR